MKKDFENQNLKTACEDNKESYINLVELNHINGNKKNVNNKSMYISIFFLILFLFLLIFFIDKNSYIVNKIAKNEKVRNYFLSFSKFSI